MAKEKDEELLTFAVLLASIEITHNDRPKYLCEAIDEALAEVVKSAHKYDGKASLKIELSVKPEKGRMIVSASLSPKKCEPGALPIAAYVDRHARLIREDPGQSSLFAPVQDIDGKKK